MKMTFPRIIRTYSELITLPTFKDRFNYLKIGGKVGEETFGFDRYLNQMLYKSKEWQNIRNYVIIRDKGCDLAIPEHEIIGENVLVHHMNPITKDDILYRKEYVLNPEYLICTILNTHNAIHYGDERLLHETELIIRTKNDTCPWRH